LGSGSLSKTDSSSSEEVSLPSPSPVGRFTLRQCHLSTCANKGSLAGVLCPLGTAQPSPAQPSPAQPSPDQTRPDQTRPDQIRPDQTRPDRTGVDRTSPNLIPDLSKSGPNQPILSQPCSNPVPELSQPITQHSPPHFPGLSALLRIRIRNFLGRPDPDS
jgi:hypothetical protein